MTFSPNLGRWLERDPIEADINTYRAFGDDPATKVDPNGLVGAASVPGQYTGTGRAANAWNPNDPNWSWNQGQVPLPAGYEVTTHEHFARYYLNLPYVDSDPTSVLVTQGCIGGNYIRLGLDGSMLPNDRRTGVRAFTKYNEALALLVAEQKAGKSAVMFSIQNTRGLMPPQSRSTLFGAHTSEIDPERIQIDAAYNFVTLLPTRDGGHTWEFADDHHVTDFNQVTNVYHWPACPQLAGYPFHYYLVSPQCGKLGFPSPCTPAENAGIPVSER